MANDIKTSDDPDKLKIVVGCSGQQYLNAKVPDSNSPNSRRDCLVIPGDQYVIVNGERVPIKAYTR